MSDSLQPLWTAAYQASLSFTISWSLLKIMSIESMMPSNHLILCRPLLLPPSIMPIIRVFSSESVLHIRWPEYWSFSFNIIPSNEYLELVSFRIDWFDLLAIQGTLQESSPAPQFKSLEFTLAPKAPPICNPGILELLEKANQRFDASSRFPSGEGRSIEKRGKDWHVSCLNFMMFENRNCVLFTIVFLVLCSQQTCMEGMHSKPFCSFILLVFSVTERWLNLSLFIY